MMFSFPEKGAIGVLEQMVIGMMTLPIYMRAYSHLHFHGAACPETVCRGPTTLLRPSAS